MKRNMMQAIAIWMIVGLAALPVHAGEGESGDHTLSPYFVVEGGDPSVDRFPLKETRAEVDISGVIADVTVTQTYTHLGTRPIHARYVFPASTRAAVHGMTMTVGEQTVIADIQERAAAQETFEAARREGKSASLLQQHRPNVFTMNVANIMPLDTVHIQLHYTELLVPTDGTYRFVFPTVVGPRYADPAAEGEPEDRWTRNPYLKEGQPDPALFSIAVRLSTGIPLQDVSCPTHRTAVEWEGKHLATIRLADNEAEGGNRDFILGYRLSGKTVSSGLMLYEGADENFFLLMVEPPERVQASDIPPREFIFLVDISGSMNGFPLNTAKALLRDLIGGLAPADRFNVVLFAGAARQMARQSVPATADNIQRAVRLIDDQQGGGGTELRSALQAALAPAGNPGVARTLIIVTDGYVAAEKAVFREIRSHLNSTSVFAFGIGSSVNRYLIEGMAAAGLGEPFVVTEPHQAPAAAKRFRDYVSSPVLTGVTVDYDGFEAYDVEPVAIPDVLASRPVTVFGKWRGTPRGTIRLSGMGGGIYQRAFAVAETEPADVNHALAALWARQRVARLCESGFDDGEHADTQAEITGIGLRYGLLTPFTAFVAVHQTVRNTEGGAETVDQPLPLPLHVSNLAVGGPMANVPEPGLLLIASVLAAMFVLRTIRRRRSLPRDSGPAGQPPRQEG